MKTKNVSLEEAITAVVANKHEETIKLREWERSFDEQCENDRNRITKARKEAGEIMFRGKKIVEMEEVELLEALTLYLKK